MTLYGVIFMIKTQKAEIILKSIALRESVMEAQGVKEGLKDPLKDFKKLQNKEKLSTRTKLILNSTGLSCQNPIIRNIIHLLEVALYLIKNKGCFIIGEQNTGKSTLFTCFLKEICEKTSGALTTAMLIGNGNISDENRINEISVLLEKVFILVEEFVDESDTNEQLVIGTLKNCMESGTFQKCKKNSKPTETTFAFVGNSYRKINEIDDLLKVKEDIPRIYQDRGLQDRIPLLLPHYHALFGETKYVESDSEVIPIQHLQQIFQELRNVRSDKIYITSEMGISLGRELNIYNSFISALCKLFYYNEEPPKWFICGLVEFLKFFRFILIENKIYNPFNKNSARLIVEMLNYSVEEIDYITFDNDRILIKFCHKNEISKVALTGFGIKNNKAEYDFYKKNKTKIIAPITNHSNDYLILTQEIDGDLPFEYRVYFDNFKEANAKKTDKGDERFNILMLEQIEKYAVMGKQFNEDELKFRGIPKFFQKFASNIIEEEFNYKKSQEVYLSDFSFNSDKIQIINFSRYIKKNIYYRIERSGEYE